MTEASIAIESVDAAPTGPLAIRDALATLPSGRIGERLGDADLALYLQTHCNRDIDKQREKSHALRDTLFHDGGVDEMVGPGGLIDRTFENDTVKQRLKRMVPISRFSNPTRRIVGEIATVYSEPAERSVGGAEGNATKYDDLCESMSIDEQMDTVCQMFNLHRALFVAPRVRACDDEKEVVLDIVSAATARVVMHPNDNTLVVGLLTRCQFRTVRGRHGKPVAWLLTTAVEWEYFAEDFTPIEGTRVEHGLGVNPWIPLCDAMYAPDFWPGDDGEGLTAAHLTGWLVESLLVKETQTATRMPVIQGDTSTMARGQAVDSANMLSAPEGTSISSVEFGTDTTVFMGVGDHALERAGNDVGLSLATLKHQGAQSADAREIILAPVRERRRRQIVKFRRFERELAEVLAIVTAKHAPELTFEFVDWRIDFGEPQVLLSKKERLEIFQTEKTLGLDSTFKFYARENPDITEDQARADVLDNLEDETVRIIAMRVMQALSGGPATAADGTPPPNGTGDGANKFSDSAQAGVSAAATADKGSPAPMGGNEGDAGPTGGN